MKNKVVHLSLLLSATFFSAIALGQQQETSHILVYGGPAFVLQRLDTVVSYAKVGGGVGGFAGAMLRYRWYNASLTHLRSRHTMDIRGIPVSMDFSDILLGLGADLQAKGEIIPYVQLCLGMTSLTDMNSEGFKGGMTFGLGAGFRGRLPGRWAYMVNAVYGFNKYDNFDTSAEWANKTKVGGNHLLAMAGLMYGLR